MHNKEFIVLGGGSAGWLTSLYLRKYFPTANISLVRDSNIGIVGVGEATVPAFVNTLRILDIPISDTFNYCNGTIKQAISFENWNGDNKNYLHAYDTTKNDYSIPDIFDFDCFIHHLKRLKFLGKDLNEHVLQYKLIYSGRVDLSNLYNAIHFDTFLLAEFLEKTGIERNINLIEGTYLTSEISENGFIKTIVLEDGRKISCDFIFDCSGFSGSILHKFFNIQKHSYAKFLPMNTAIPYWLDYRSNQDIPTYTIATAMKYGWTWQIPLQHRIGSGYVFDSNYITADQAKQEVEQSLGYNIDVRRIIKFEPFRLEKFWYKNCIAVGLASGFLEPLESTSLWLSIHVLEMIRYYMNEIIFHDEKAIESFNEVTRKSWDHLADFIYLHYITKRSDSLFWKEFRIKNTPSDRILNILDLLKTSSLKTTDLSTIIGTTSFQLNSYYQVGCGLDINSPLESMKMYGNIVPDILKSDDFIKNYIESSTISHKDAILMLKSGRYNKL
ncbi:MAG: tryptophan 7-halogenase [Proteobacteria bacterium]|nr:tryptophan 7-halogenase [Pseudomonadota bacterium]NBP15698.1 tryptophan 7-halogenase [bacterium]